MFELHWDMVKAIDTTDPTSVPFEPRKLKYNAVDMDYDSVNRVIYWIQSVPQLGIRPVNNMYSHFHTPHFFAFD